MERITDGVAVLAVISGVNPEIYRWMGEFSQLAALLMPILGCIWLGVQIWARIVRDK